MVRRLGAAALIALIAAASASAADEAAYGRGLAAYRAGAYAEAIAAFDAALAEEPDSTAALYYRGLARAHEARFDEAIADLQKVEPALPDVPVAGDLGVACYYAGRRAEAEQWLNKAAQNRTSAGPANLLLGIMAYEAGDLTRAQTHLAEADAAGDARVKGTASYYLGLVAVRTERSSDARGAFEQAQAAGEPAVSQAASDYLADLSGQAPAGAPASDLAPYSLHGYGGFQYDSNVLIADIPYSQRQALPFDPAKDDGRFVLGLGATYYAIANEQALLQFSYDFYQSLFFSVDRLDLQGHTLSGLFEYGDSFVVPGIQASYSYYMTDGTSSYLGRAYVSPYAVVQEEGLGQTEVYYDFFADDYLGAPFNPYRDGINNAIGARQVFFLGSADRRLDIGYRWNEISTDGNSAGAQDFDVESNQVDVGLGMNVLDLAWVDVRWLFSNDDYLHGNSRSPPVVTIQPDGTRTVSRLRRRDDRNVVTLVISREITDHVYATLGYYFTDSGSNLPVFQYSRSILSAGVGVTF